MRIVITARRLELSAMKAIGSLETALEELGDRLARLGLEVEITVVVKEGGGRAMDRGDVTVATGGGSRCTGG